MKAPSSKHWTAREFPTGNGLEVGIEWDVVGKQGRADGHVGLPKLSRWGPQGPRAAQSWNTFQSFPHKGKRARHHLPVSPWMLVTQEGCDPKAEGMWFEGRGDVT